MSISEEDEALSGASRGLQGFSLSVQKPETIEYGTAVIESIENGIDYLNKPKPVSKRNVTPKIIKRIFSTIQT